jgi:glycerate 2-kinase
VHIVCACDSFKESIGTIELNFFLQQKFNACGYVADSFPMSDGGEGFLAVMLANMPQLRRDSIQVQGPMAFADGSCSYLAREKSEPVLAHFGFDAVHSVFVAEMAQSSGMSLVDGAQRNAMLASSYGTGQVLAVARRLQAQTIILGLGGSATSDGGAGALQALGYGLYDYANQLMAPGVGGAHLTKIARIVAPPICNDSLLQAKIILAADVTNPLYGPQGAAWVYGPQKGASEAQCNALNQGLEHWAGRLEAFSGKPVRELAGGGAAGGIGAALYAVLGASMQSGSSLCRQYGRFAQRLVPGCTIVTGEGRLDATSFQGKVVGSLLKHVPSSMPIVVVCGQCSVSKQQWQSQGIKNVFVLSQYAPISNCMESPWQVINTNFASLQSMV